MTEDYPIFSKAELMAAILAINWEPTKDCPVVGYMCLDFLTGYSNYHAEFNQKKLKGLLRTERELFNGGHTKTQYLLPEVRLLKHKEIKHFYFLPDQKIYLVGIAGGGRAMKAVDEYQFIYSRRYHIWRSPLAAKCTSGEFRFGDWA